MTGPEASSPRETFEYGDSVVFNFTNVSRTSAFRDRDELLYFLLLSTTVRMGHEHPVIQRIRQESDNWRSIRVSVQLNNVSIPAGPFFSRLFEAYAAEVHDSARELLTENPALEQMFTALTDLSDELCSRVDDVRDALNTQFDDALRDQTKRKSEQP